MGQERRELSSLETTSLPQTQMMANVVRSSEHSTEEWSRCLFTLKAQKSNLLSLSTQNINKNKERKRYQMRGHVALQRAQEKGKSTYLRRKY
jgi:ethanolamine utilization protein EutQ (cupin superfamily)